MTKRDEGYTRLPNALIDSQMMAELSDKAFKCLLLIIRQTLGFDRTTHSISLTQFQKYCGIKKRDTVMGCIKELEEAGVIEVARNLGRLNSYSLTLDQYQQKGLVPTKGTSPNDGDGTSTAKQDEGSPVERGTNKENIKYKFKNIKKDDDSVDNSETEIFSDSIEYHEDNKNLYSLRELAGVYTIQTDLADQAKRINPKLDDAKILSELKNFAQWSTSREKTTAQGWMNYWIYRIQKLSAPKAKSSKPKSKGLSDAQVNYFASELCNYQNFKSKHSNVGESQKAFETRISSNIRKTEYADTYGPYLHELGFVVDLGASL
jgi:phage replication O-like protein O